MYDKIGKCDCCENDEVQVGSFKYPFGLDDPYKKDRSRWLCHLCASSEAGSLEGIISVRNAEEIGERLAIMKHICFIGNEIIKEIRKPREIK